MIEHHHQKPINSRIVRAFHRNPLGLIGTYLVLLVNDSAEDGYYQQEINNTLLEGNLIFLLSFSGLCEFSSSSSFDLLRKQEQQNVEV